ncbi:MAG TPA: hypothetical protein VJ715_09970 [Pyrinomonadaceae bacterium]|nr:hypothetical protein [Pyrinomonadaceae bacterium]
MKKALKGWLVAALFLLAQSSIKAQDDPRPFNPLAESVESAIKEEFPDWKRESIPPLSVDRLNPFSDEIIIDQWSSAEATVRVAILSHPTKEAAREALKQFVANLRADRIVSDAGNEAYVSVTDKQVAFRKGIYTVYVSGGQHEFSENGEPLAPTETKYVKTFAQIVAKALKGSE